MQNGPHFHIRDVTERNLGCIYADMKMGFDYILYLICLRSVPNAVPIQSCVHAIEYHKKTCSGEVGTDAARSLRWALFHFTSPYVTGSHIFSLFSVANSIVLLAQTVAFCRHHWCIWCFFFKECYADTAISIYLDYYFLQPCQPVKIKVRVRTWSGSSWWCHKATSFGSAWNLWPIGSSENLQRVNLKNK